MFKKPASLSLSEANKIQKSPAYAKASSGWQDLKSQCSRLLRKEGGHRAIHLDGIADPARVELDPAVVEAEEGRAREGAIPVRRILVASAVDPEIVNVGESVLMREDHAGDLECSESELFGHEDLASPAHAAAPVMETELCGNDQDVVALLSTAERLELLRGPLMLAEILRSEPTFAVVAEAATLPLDQIEHLLQGFLVGLADRLPPRNGEPSFGALRKRLLGEFLVGEPDARNEPPQDVGLLGHALRLGVAGEIPVTGLDFLVRELVSLRKLVHYTKHARL